MSDSTTGGDSAYKVLSRTALYTVILAWIILGFYIFSIYDSFSEEFLGYFLSMDRSGVKFRALILLAPFILTALGYLINERAKLFRKSIAAEKELRQRTIELESVNELLSRENSERKKAEDLLTRQAFYDSLTNLPNRALFIDRLRSSLERKKRYPDHSFAILFLDLDRFKVINDSLGHLIGDQLLVMLAQRLKKHIRSVDTIARFGGDEFAVLMEDTREISGVYDIAERFHGEMRSPFSIFGREIFTTMSIGIVMSNTGDYTKPEELLRDADTAMYHAKERGKACHVVFDSTMHAKATVALWVETELRRAVEQNDFIVYYQPIISVEENKITGFEALLRWQHAERGIITPSEFITVAEETGLIIPLGERVIREACRQLKAWQEQFPTCRDLTVSANVSSRVFSQPDFFDFIKNILEETGLEGSCLRLEIVERTLIENPEPAAALMKRFEDLNVRFDIDDFGTGYSALNYLRHFPIKGLKIDGSFINALTFDKNNTAIVKTVIALGRDLGLDVIAEGVETVEQLDVFKTMKGEYAQGFYLFRPMDSKAVGDLLSSHSVVSWKERFP
ncbi:MAG: EAL domain-containing protein [Nitrospiraceae bacterium]|nr:EAL domain-containing protein [Nitrospiraceae bacterium]